MGIYQQPHRSILTITVGGAALAASLLFAAYSLQVDNRTSQYLYLPDIQQYVFPYQTGVILPFGPSTNVRANFAPPPGIAQPAAIAGQVARIEAFDLALPPSPGTLQSMDVNLTNGSIDANITNSTLDTNANITNANINANITNSSIDTNVTGGTINANITNAQIDASITNSQVNIQDVTPNIELSMYVNAFGVGSGSTTAIQQLPDGKHIRGWSVSSTTGGQIDLFLGPLGAPGTRWWTGQVQANTPVNVIFAPGISITTAPNYDTIWIFVQTGGTICLNVWYSST